MQLAAHDASFLDLASEMLFLRDVRRELPLVLEVRRRVLADLGQAACAPSPEFMQQAPVSQGASVELSASAVIPRRRDLWSIRDVRATPPCGCEGCVRSAARLIRLGDQISLHMTNIYGAGGIPFEQALDMFLAAERLLAQCGMGFRHVVRTWIYLRDVNRDYDALNQARREFFRRRGIELRPASTGVQGTAFPDAHDFSMNLYAVKGPQPVDITGMSAVTLNQAWRYGADFSRGVRVAETNKIALYVSGTASIDETGRTAHAGNFKAQVERMLHNIASLLAAQGATFEDVFSAVTYLKHASDAPVLRAMCHERGFDGFPSALVEASLCRSELLCEAEAVAMLPRQPERSQ